MSSLAYIDDVIDKEIERRQANVPASLNDADRAKAEKSAMRSIAGFQVKDEEAEKEALDKIVAQREKRFADFRKDRQFLRERMKQKEIEPLAIVPRLAWTALCDRAKLFRLTPVNGKVGLNSSALNKYITERSESKKGMFGRSFTVKYASATAAAIDGIEADAKKDWPGFLLSIFGGLEAARGDRVTVILPTPPADVAKVLLKAQSLEGLKVAAVAEAISFMETPAEILRGEVARREAAYRAQERYDADPIVYYEQGSATAIIAQFGDFPIEKAMVDAVVASNNLISDKEAETVTYAAPSPEEYIRQQMMVDLQRARQQAMRPPWAGGGGLLNLYSPSNMATGITGITTNTF